MAIGVRLLGTPLVLAATIIAARVMSPQDFGYVATFLALASICSIPTTSLERLLLREMSRTGSADATGAWSVRYLVASSLLSVVIASVVGVLVALVGSPLPSLIFPLAGVTGMLMGVLRSAQAAHRANDDFVAGQVPNEIGRPGLVCVGFILAGIVTSSEVTFGLGAAIYLVSTALMLVWVLPHLWSFRGRMPEAPVRVRLRRATAWFTSTTALSLLSDRSTEIFAGFLIPGARAGALAVALRAGSMCAFGLSIGQFLYAPAMARLRESGDPVAQVDIIRRVRLLSNAFAAVFALPLLIAPGFVLTVLAPEFREYTGVLRIVAMAGVINAWTGPSQILLEMGNLERIVTYSFAISLAVNVVVTFPLIGRYGPAGAGLAFTLATLAREVYLTVVCYRRSRVWVGPAMIGRALRLRVDAPASF